MVRRCSTFIDDGEQFVEFNRKMGYFVPAITTLHEYNERGTPDPPIVSRRIQGADLLLPSSGQPSLLDRMSRIPIRHRYDARIMVLPRERR